MSNYQLIGYSFLKLLKKLAFSTAYMDANTKCAFIFGQSEQPKSVQKLKR